MVGALLVAGLLAATWWLFVDDAGSGSSATQVDVVGPDDVVRRPTRPIVPPPARDPLPREEHTPQTPAAAAPAPVLSDLPTNAQLGIERPEARPVGLMLWAARRRAEDVVATLYSERLGARIARQGWREHTLEMSIATERLYGDYSLEDFGYRFDGTRTEGVVRIVHRGETKGSMRVAREGDRWVLDER